MSTILAMMQKWLAFFLKTGLIHVPLKKCPLEEIIVNTTTQSNYKAGAFYQRELPCILQLLLQLPKKPNVIVIDGYVWLGANRPGLGAHLFKKLSEECCIIGVAKNKYYYNFLNTIEICRGNSKKPLFITAAGMDKEYAAFLISAMQGKYRIPKLIKRADELSRN